MNEFTKEDAEFLLEKLNSGEKVLMSFGDWLPTIHEIRNARHCGFGVFIAETSEYKVSFCGGGAMSRTPSGHGWCVLGVERGEYPYDMDKARASLEAFIAGC